VGRAGAGGRLAPAGRGGSFGRPGLRRGGPGGMTTFHPDSLEQDVDVLRRINREFDGRLALNCYVVTPGAVGVGDPVELVP